MHDPLERYDRQIMIGGFGEEGQRKLKEASVFIAGAGQDSLYRPIFFFNFKKMLYSFFINIRINNLSSRNFGYFIDLSYHFAIFPEG